MATQTQVSQTIGYRGPTILLAALAHMLREGGLDFTPPRDDRTCVAEVVEATLTVRPGATALHRTLDDMIDPVVATFRRRFGDSPASITVGDTHSPEA
jgi:hypothetical protein